ncbi:MAG: PepSY domain-containing protein [Paracoccaceae bacterium]
MKSKLLLALAVAALPVGAFAEPKVGDMVGTNADDATAALEAQGCKVNGFEMEDGKVEARCTETASGKVWDLYIDPKTGAIADAKAAD